MAKSVEQRRAYYQKNKERINRVKKEWRKKNRIKLSEQRKEYYQNNKEKFKKRRKEYYHEHKEETLKKQKEYRTQFHEMICFKNKIYNESQAGRERQQRYVNSEKGKLVRLKAKRNWQRKRKIEYRYTMQAGKIKVRFVRENEKYYYTSWCGSKMLSKSEPFDTLKLCKQDAKIYFE